MAYLTLQDISKSFGGTVAVENFELAAETGEFVSFLGPSGCGKTTTLRMIAGFEHPTTGSIQIEGNDITRIPPNQRNVGMVFQSYALFPNMTVAKNVGFGLKVRGRPKSEVDSRVKEMLDLIQMSHLAHRYPFQLSGGQQQRVALARALASDPQIVLLDEPLSAVDVETRTRLLDEIEEAQSSAGIPFIYVTHNEKEAERLEKNRITIKSGRIDEK